MAPARNSPRDESVLAPFIYIANGPGVHSPVPRAAVYGFRLRETHVSAPKLTVLQLRQGATTGMVCGFDSAKDFKVASPSARTFECCAAVTNKTLEVSGRRVADAKAVLVINGTLDGMKQKAFQKMIGAQDAVESFGAAFGAQPGLIYRHVVCSTWGKRDVIGGVYLFESVADVETYLNSDFWSKCETETKWTDVVGEVFEIV